MGFLKSLEKPFRTGASRAAKNAAASSEVTAAKFDEIVELLKPSADLGSRALKGFNFYTDPSNLDYLYGLVSDSDVSSNMIADRERYVEQAMAHTGMRNSGNRLRAAADLPTDVVTGIMDQILSLKQNAASLGLGQGASILGGIGGIQSANNAASAAAMNQANNRAGILGGLIGGGGAVLGGLLSDRRFKKNAEIVGQVGLLNVWSWEWADGAEELTESDLIMTTGFMADEVREVYPQHVHPVEINGIEILTVDYDSLMNEEGMRDAA